MQQEIRDILYNAGVGVETKFPTSCTGRVHRRGATCKTAVKSVRLENIKADAPLCGTCFTQGRRMYSGAARDYLAIIAWKLYAGVTERTYHEATVDAMQASLIYYPRHVKDYLEELINKAHELNKGKALSSKEYQRLNKYSAAALAAADMAAEGYSGVEGSTSGTRAVVHDWVTRKAAGRSISKATLRSHYMNAAGDTLNLIPDRVMTPPEGIKLKSWIREVVEKEAAEAVERIVTELNKRTRQQLERDEANQLVSFVRDQSHGSKFYYGSNESQKIWGVLDQTKLTPHGVKAGRCTVYTTTRLNLEVIKRVGTQTVLDGEALTLASTEIFQTLMRDNPNANIQATAETARLL